METEYLTITQLPEFIQSMSLEEFDVWCKTDRDGLIGELDFDLVYSVVSKFPELSDYEDYLFKMIKDE